MREGKDQNGHRREREMPKRGKTYLEARKKVNREAKYSLDEALDLLKDTAFAKFDEGLGDDPRRRCFEEISRLAKIYSY